MPLRIEINWHNDDNQLLTTHFLRHTNYNTRLTLRSNPNQNQPTLQPEVPLVELKSLFQLALAGA